MLKGALLITNISDNEKVKNIPRRFDKDMAIVLTAADKKHQRFVIMTGSVEEKEFWVNHIRGALQKDIGPFKSLKPLIINHNDLFVQNVLSQITNTDSLLPVMVACYIGSVSFIITNLSLVCKSWSNALKFSKDNNSFWTWILRHGTVSSSYRWLFWRKMLDVSCVISQENFDELRNQTSSFVTYEIEKDVSRSFGMSNKRTVVRRSIIVEKSYSLDDSDGDNGDESDMIQMQDRYTDMEGINSPDKSSEYEDDAFSSSTDTSAMKSSGMDFPPSQMTTLYRQESAVSNHDIDRKKLSLSRILSALASRFQSVGYCQGLDRIVIHVMRAGRCAVSDTSLTDSELLHRETFDALRERVCFSVIESLFNKLNLCDIYSSNGVFGLKLRLWQLAVLIEIYCPTIHAQMLEENVNLEVFCISWVQTLFLGIEAMPAITVDRVWDIFIHECSWVIIFQVALAIIRLSEKKLLLLPIDQVIMYFNQYPDPKVLDCKNLLDEASTISFDESTLNALEEYYKANCC